MTPDEFESAAHAKAKETAVAKRKARRRHKFNATPLRLNGRYFHSQAEGDFFKTLEARQEAAEISDLKCQPKVELLPGVTYRPDFSYLENTRSPFRQQVLVYVDVKGVETERFRLMKKLWHLVGPATLRIVRRGGKKAPWRDTEVILGQPSTRIKVLDQLAIAGFYCQKEKA